MTDQEFALRAAIVADPADDTVRLGYADWLDEQAQDLPAEYPHAAGFAAYIRACVALGECEALVAGTRRCRELRHSPHAMQALFADGLMNGKNRHHVAATDAWHAARSHLGTSGWATDGVWERGFPVEVATTLSQWLKYGHVARTVPFEKISFPALRSWDGRWVRFSDRGDEANWRRPQKPDGHSWDVEEILPGYHRDAATLPDWLFRHLPTVGAGTVCVQLESAAAAALALSDAALKWARLDGEVV